MPLQPVWAKAVSVCPLQRLAMLLFGSRRGARYIITAPHGWYDQGTEVIASFNRPRVHDCTSFKHDGQMVNAGWATGLSGGGGSFDGGWVAVPDDPKLQITRELTVCAWVRVREFPTTAPSGFLPTAYIVGKRSNGTNGWRLALGAQPEVMIGVLPSSDLKGAMPSTGWTHVAAVYRPSVSIELYVNGKSAAQVTTTIPTAITDSQSELRIGNRYDVR